MAIIEFVIGPQNYFEGNYFDGDYTLTNVSKAYLQCDIDNIKGGRVITGEYFQDNYIDGTYWHANVIKSELVAEVMIVQEAVITMQGYYQEGYYQSGYYGTSGGNFVLTASLDRYGMLVEADAQLVAETTADIVVGAIKESTAELTAEFTQSISFDNFVTVEMFAFSDAQLEVQLDSIKQANVELSTTFSAAIDGSRTIVAFAQADSLVDIYATGERTRNEEAATTAAFSLTTDIGVIKQGSAEQYSLFSPNLTVSAIKNSFAVLDATTSIDVIINKTATLQSALLSQSSITSTAKITRTANVNLTAQFTLTGNAIKTKPTGSDMSAAFTISKFNPRVFKRGFANLQTTANLSLSSITVYEKYWIDYVSSQNGNETFSGSSSAISNNYGEIFSLTISQTRTAGNDISPYSDPVLTKYNSRGDIEWIKETQFNIVSTVYPTLASDSTGAVYGLINQYDSPTYPVSYTDMFLIKWSRTGVVQWTRKLSNSTYGYESARNLKIDSSDNIYVLGLSTRDGLTGSYPCITKYNTSGVRSWSKDYVDLGGFVSADFASNGDLILLGSTRNTPQSDEEALWARIDPNGSIVWIRAMQDTTDTYETSLKSTGSYNSIVVDNNNNSYSIFGYSSDKTFYKPLISKLDSSGNIIWQKIYDTPSNDERGNGIAITGSNLYISTSDGYVANLDLDGQVLWSRRFNSGSSGPSLRSIGFTLNKNLLLSSGSGVFKLSSQGNKPGTYDNGWTITDTGFTVSDLSSVTYVPTTEVFTSEITSTAVSYNTTETKTVYTKTYTDLTLVKASAQLTSSFTSTIRIGRKAVGDALLNATTSIVARGQRNVKFAISAQATTQLSASLSIVKTPGIAALAVTTNVNTTAIVQASAQSEFNLTANVYTDPNRIRGISQGIFVQASAQATAYEFTKATVDIESISTLTVEPYKIQQLSSDIVAFYSELAAVNKIGEGLIGLDANVTVQATASITADQPQFMRANTSMTATGYNTQYGHATLGADTSLDLSTIYLRRNESHVTVNAELTATISRIRDNTVSTGSSFYQFAYTEDSKTTGYNAAWYSTTSVQADNQILRLGQAELTATTEIPYVYAGILVRIEANLLCEGFQLTAGRVIHLDEYYQIKIDSESRYLVINQETRIITIESETRVNKIIGYQL